MFSWTSENESHNFHDSGTSLQLSYETKASREDTKIHIYSHDRHLSISIC